MKKASLILSQLSNLPQFKLLRKQKCYQKYLSLLSPKWQKAIAFLYIRDNTLFIAIKHPGFKMELNYNRDLLKSLLTQLNRYDKSCSELQAQKVVIFTARHHTVIEETPHDPQTVPYYHELSSATFPVYTEDRDIKQRFDRLKHSIQSNLTKHR